MSKPNVVPVWRCAGGCDLVVTGPDQWCLACAADSYLSLNPVSGMTKHDLSAELWREYDFGGRVYRIVRPVTLYVRDGGSTHRVLDAVGVMHCAPAPGVAGCVLRWAPSDLANPVQF